MISLLCFRKAHHTSHYHIITSYKNMMAQQQHEEEEFKSLDEYIQHKRQLRDERCQEAYDKAIGLDTSFLGAPCLQTPYTTSKQTGVALRAEYEAMQATLQKRLAEISAAIAIVEKGAVPIDVPRYIGAKFRAMEANNNKRKKPKFATST